MPRSPRSPRSPRTSRRRLLDAGVALGLGAFAGACSRKDPPASASRAYELLNEPESAVGLGTQSRGAVPQHKTARVVEWSFGSDASTEARAAVMLPAGGPDERFPVLVALHGRGEARKGPELGALGWPLDYALTRAVKRLGAPPLRTEDFEGFVTPRRLAEHNAALARAPYRGLVVVCPYLPDLDLKSPLALRDYASYVTQVVLPRVRRELPVFPTRAATGIDGVSLGGIVALRVGLAAPDEFACVGSLQAAIDDAAIPELVESLRAARARAPSLRLRLLTSEGDYFRRVVTATSQAMRAASLEHEYLLVPGPHDYPFNRGPGAIEMLTWHERLLARS